MKRLIFFLAAFCTISALTLSPGAALCGKWDAVSAMLGRRDAAVVISPEKEILFVKNPDMPLVPASTLKLVTALAAFYHLGADFRFKTEFYLDSGKNLVIKGYGDPMLISEEVERIAEILTGRITMVRDIVLDDSRFAPGIDIPGTRTGSGQPYDAPVGALCVNFNTVNVKKVKNGYVSAEPQTPLLPAALKRLEKMDVSAERILLSSQNMENLIYAGELFAYFLKHHGVDVKGEIRQGLADPGNDFLLYRHRSLSSLTDVVAGLMEHSNNFVANQLLLAAGAEAYGPPGTLEKGLRAVKDYAKDKLGIALQMVEGSGISRQNRMTARMFVPVLEAFAPYFFLLPGKNGIHFKTGTLDGIRSRAGYIEKNGKFFGFAVLINTPSKNAEPVVKKIASAVVRGR